MTKLNKTEMTTLSLERDLASAKEVLAKFSADLLTDPAYAMEWGDRAVTAAGQVSVLGAAIAALKNGAEPAKVRAHAVEQALRSAKWPSRSTSQMTNLTAQAKGETWAFVAERLDWVNDKNA